MSILFRNLEPAAVFAAGVRLSSADMRSEALATTQFICFSGGEAPVKTRRLVANILQNALQDFHMTPEFIRWILRGLEGEFEQKFSKVVESIAQLQFVSDIESEPIPEKSPQNTWFIIRGTDVLLDILLQPLQALTDIVRTMVETWNSSLSKFIPAFPDLASYDPDLHGLEILIAESMANTTFGATEADFNVRFGVVTTSNISLGSDRASLYSEADLDAYGFRRVEEGAPFPTWENIDLVVNQSVRGLLDNARPNEGAWRIDPYFGHVYRESVMMPTMVFIPTVIVRREIKSARILFFRIEMSHRACRSRHSGGSMSLSAVYLVF
ncbi:hypothetical protein NHF46_00775 [Arthrobacter alpinus]|nr:hypothetical protein [Arthrobacter alpinus]